MEKSPVQRVADEVRGELARQHRTQTDLAEVLGIKQSAVSRRLTGVVPFDVAELAIVAAYLGVEPGALLGTAA